jgi:hypothetical protein
MDDGFGDLTAGVGLGDYRAIPKPDPAKNGKKVEPVAN